MTPKKTSISRAGEVIYNGTVSVRRPDQGFFIEKNGVLLEQVLIAEATSADILRLSRRVRQEYGPGTTVKRMTERQENVLNFYWADLMLRRN